MKQDNGEKKVETHGLLLLGGFLFFSMFGVGVFYFTEVHGINISHSQDESRFDPILAKDDVLALAGSDFAFSMMSATLVRADGTQDFSNKEYPPKTSYTFVGRTSGPPPIGAMSANVPGIEIMVRSKGTSTSSQLPGQTRFHYNFGLLKRKSYSAGLGLHPFPSCSFKALWGDAIMRGAPKEALASIDYRDGAYWFRILGTEFEFQYDQNCRAVLNSAR